MQSNVYSVWRVRGVTFLLFALAAGSVVYWALQGWTGGPASGAPLAAVASQAPLDSQAVARALGGGVAQASAGPAPVAASRRFVLMGVVAGLSSSGAALISVDGKPAKPFPVGASVDGRLVLKLVQGRRALLAPSMEAPAEVTLELPPLVK